MHSSVHTSYHVHTTWSDGSSTLEEYQEAAQASGLAEWGISDHLVLRPDGAPISWSMDPARLPFYVEAVRAQQERTPASQPLRLGLELDWFPGQEKVIADVLDGQRFDFVMGSVHYLDDFCIDDDLERWKTLGPAGVNEAWRGYFERIAGLARSGLFSFVAHLDLPKAFDFRPTVDLSREIGAALDEIARAGMAVEVNTSGWGRACREAYPSLEILGACRSRGIPALVNADAHNAGDLTRGLDRGLEWLKSAGYRQIVRFDDRHQRAVAI